MARYVEMVRAREEDIAKLIELLSEKSDGFENPKLILIGGYGLRAFIPFLRSTRDCDFALKKENRWYLDWIKKWLTNEVSIETCEKKDGSGYMRCIKLIKIGRKQVRVSLDFMEGEVTGRAEKDVVRVDERFISDSWKAKIRIGGREVEVRVPSYVDYFILKVVSGRASDARDIATLLWKNGMPKGLKERIREVMPHPEVFEEKLRKSILPIIEDKRFLHSWRGDFHVNRIQRTN
ncbi:nucleotidyl transferase AbiEii/AbiGii toxin family protein [Candidatus Bathyarchaeota archaeon]|nr:nucleotidyl transferase AbiEii/AbiGii toxin family protein [Candidatus Bathyarchaeota archaeon]MBS7618479.1 nucleotidyl transferase AbiEii/AbiGii toxin family protein [Candidatus Bathyarchaeota archaeon]